MNVAQCGFVTCFYTINRDDDTIIKGYSFKGTLEGMKVGRQVTCHDIALKRSTRGKFELGRSCCWSSTSSNSKHYTAELVIYKANISITTAAEPKMHISIAVPQFHQTYPTALVSYSANLYDLMCYEKSNKK